MFHSNCELGAGTTRAAIKIAKKCQISTRLISARTNGGQVPDLLGPPPVCRCGAAGRGLSGGGIGAPIGLTGAAAICGHHFGSGIRKYSFGVLKFHNSSYRANTSV